MAKGKIKLKKWDIADYLKTQEDIEGFLEAAIEEGGDDPEYIAHVLGVIARAKGMTKIAKETGLSRATLYKALAKGGNPEFATVLKVINALGIKLQVSSA
ncbi:MAG: putative addiction module antidote protein [Rickettsiales bacterium]